MITFLPNWIALKLTDSNAEVYRLKIYSEQIRLLNFAVFPDKR